MQQMWSHKEEDEGKRGHCVYVEEQQVDHPPPVLTPSIAFTRLSVAEIIKSRSAEPTAACLLPN